MLKFIGCLVSKLGERLLWIETYFFNGECFLAEKLLLGLSFIGKVPRTRLPLFMWWVAIGFPEPVYSWFDNSFPKFVHIFFVVTLCWIFFAEVRRWRVIEKFSLKKASHLLIHPCSNIIKVIIIVRIPFVYRFPIKKSFKRILIDLIAGLLFIPFQEVLKCIRHYIRRVFQPLISFHSPEELPDLAYLEVPYQISDI